MATSASTHHDAKPTVIALHCSLGSGRQWSRLADALGNGFDTIAPDLAGYGNNIAGAMLPTRLADEVTMLGEQIDHATGPVHLVGHSYGGAVAFKMATSARWRERIRSLTLIEPVLPTLLADKPADKRLHDLFAELGTRVHVDLCNGMYMEALDRFLDYWNGSGPRQQLAGELRLRMIEVIEKLAFDFTAIFAEENVAAAAESLRVPALLVSGGLSPYMTQRVVTRLAALIPGAATLHLPAAGHMLPITHGKLINPEIVRHIELAEDFANVMIAEPCGRARANRARAAERREHLRLIPG